MIEAPIPDNELERLGALRALEILYTPAEARFDAITERARSVFKVPIALISLVDEKCQWFKSAPGLDVSETSRRVSFCAHAIAIDDDLIVENATADPRFQDNPLVTETPRIRFYAGVPLRHMGLPIGTLCIIDTIPRSFHRHELELLHQLGKLVEAEFAKDLRVYAGAEETHAQSDPERKALLDPVTMTWNREALEWLIPHCVMLGPEECECALLLLIQLEFTVDQNTDGNPPTTSILLREAVLRLREILEPSDLLARFSEDVLLIYRRKGCDSDTAAELSGAISQKMKDWHSDSDALGDLSVRMGTATYIYSADADMHQLIDTAQRALDAASASEDSQVVHRVVGGDD